MRRWPALLLLAALLVGCGGDGGSGATNAPDGTFTIAETTIDFVDPSRPTAANGTAPGSDMRTLHTAIFYPAAPGRFPLIVFSHGLGALARI